MQEASMNRRVMPLYCTFSVVLHVYYEKSGKIIQQTEVKLSLDRDSSVILNNIGAVLRDLIPIDNIPPVGNICGSKILVFQVVSLRRSFQRQV